MTTKNNNCVPTPNEAAPAPSQTDDTTELLISIDTELSNFDGGFGLWANTQGGEFGLRFILRLCEELDLPALFFLDVYGKGKDAREQRKASEIILEAGQRCELHTHPGPCFDIDRPRLNQYHEDEQREILRFGSERLHRWGGIETTCHRAGDWAANKRTIKALETAGFVADFSLNRWARFCRVPGRMTNANQPFRAGHHAMEFPATAFRGFLNRLRYLSLEHTSITELAALMKAQKTGPVVLTMHSFTFGHIGWQLRPNPALIERFRAIIELIRENNWRVAHVDDILGYTASNRNGRLPRVRVHPEDSFWDKVRGCHACDVPS